MLAVSGSTGKNEDGDHISPLMYDNAYDILIDTMNEAKDFELISGGCAFADHLAVRAFNEGIATKLILSLPAEFSNKYENSKFGKIANHHHDHFNKICNLNSFEEISQAINNGAEVYFCKDFFDRNNVIIDNSNKLIVFTFDQKTIIDDYYISTNRNANIPPPSVRDAWNKAKHFKFKRHVGYKGMRGFND